MPKENQPNFIEIFTIRAGIHHITFFFFFFSPQPHANTFISIQLAQAAAACTGPSVLKLRIRPRPPPLPRPLPAEHPNNIYHNITCKHSEIENGFSSIPLAMLQTNRSGPS